MTALLWHPTRAFKMATAELSYPLKVIYCGVCGVPPEFCEYGPEYEKCKAWLHENRPEEFETLVGKVTDEMGNLDVDEKEGKKRQTRGGKAIRAAKKKTSIKKIIVTKEQRSKKKSVTIVSGLKTFEIDLKKASKLFANKFSCGSSVTGDDEIVIQGDVSYDIIELIQNTWPEEDFEDL